MKEQLLHQATKHCSAAIDALKNEMPVSEARTLIREIFAVFVLLRWIDLQDNEKEAMAVFDGRSYQSLLPQSLQWRHWAHMDNAHRISERLRELRSYVGGLAGDTTHPLSAYLHPLVEPLRRALDVNLDYLLDLLHWVAKIPFETTSDRSTLIDLLDQIVAKTGNTRDGEFSTSVSIARLMAGLANPRAGDRVFDPCFGFGNILVATWQHAERCHIGQSRPEPLLQVKGIEGNNGAFLIGLTRMLLAGIATPQLELGNSLEYQSLSEADRPGFDVILAHPPYDGKLVVHPSPSIGVFYTQFPVPNAEPPGLFIQHALAHLKPHGRAVIAVPEGFLFRGGPDRELRRYLIDKGQIEAVIGLPAGVLEHYSKIKICLLILNKQGGNKLIRMTDATGLFNKQPASGAVELSIGAEKILGEEIFRPNLRNPHGITPEAFNMIKRSPGSWTHVWEVGASDLAIYDWDLTPRIRMKDGLNHVLSSLKNDLGESYPIAQLSEVTDISSGIQINTADLLDEPPQSGTVGYVRVRDIRNYTIMRISSWLPSNLVNERQRWALQAGDVLVTKSGTIGKTALVRNGAIGSVAGNGIYVLRPDQQRLDAGYLLAYLATPACQQWLVAQSRGSVIQHINRAVLDNLLIPLPPLNVQIQAGMQFRDLGGDILKFLAQVLGSSESDRVSTWLEELDAKVPKFLRGIDETPPLFHFEPIVALANKARIWLDQEQLDAQAMRWLGPLTQALLPLTGLANIPPGPALLSILQDAKHGVMLVLEQATGHLPNESQAHAITERLHDWLLAYISDLVDAVGLTVRSSPESLLVGSFAEFSIELENRGTLPLRDLRVETQPDWGIAEHPYLAERTTFALYLRGLVPMQLTDLSLRLLWQARTLPGRPVDGQIELAIRVVESEQANGPSAPQLGGSPYVTGSPLEPQHGHSVFYGREELISKISRQIATHGNVVLLEGNRRAGKTSILKHLEGRTAIPGWIAVYSSLQGAEGASQSVGVPTVEVFREIARSIATALTKLGKEVPLPNGHTIAAGKPALGVARACREGISPVAPFADLRDYLELVLALLEPLGLGIVLMLDEFDKLQEGIDNKVTSPQVPENLRFLIQTYPKFSAILTGSRRLKRLREEYWSALYGLGTSIPVTALDVEDARKVVIEPVREHLTYSQEAVDRVIEVTARQPYLMQCLCNRIFDFAVQTKSNSIITSMVNEAALALVRDNEHFASLWNYASLGPETGRYRRQLILLLSAKCFKHGEDMGFTILREQLAQEGVEVDDEALDTDLSYLRELELIEYSGEIGDGKYRLAIPLIADWIEQHQDANVVVSHARSEAEEENV